MGQFTGVYVNRFGRLAHKLYFIYKDTFIYLLLDLANVQRYSFI